jgi:AraC-like DNA-binding protein
MPNQAEKGVLPIINYMSYRECMPGWSIVRQTFPFWDITYVLGGSAKYLINGVSHELKEGDLLCMPKGSVRQAYTWPDKLMRCYAVNFDLRDTDGRDAALPFPLISTIGRHQELIYLFEDLFRAWNEQQPGYTIKTTGLFQLILHRLFELIVYKTDAPVLDFRIEKVIRYITQHYTENLTVKKMAALSKLNVVYFGALFKKETGCTLHQYIMRIRIKHAEKMLRSGEFKVAEIAKRCGYSDVFYFDKQFKMIMGKTPSSYFPKRNIQAQWDEYPVGRITV